MLFRYGDFNVGLTEELDSRPEREADDIAVAAVVGLNRPENVVLNRVRAGFVERVSARDRNLDLGVGIVAHDDSGDGVTEERGAAAASHDSDGGDDNMFASAKGPEHAARVVSFEWLAEDCAVEGDQCVGCDEDRVRVKEPGSLGLHTGEATRDDLRIATGCCGFVHVDRAHFER